MAELSVGKNIAAEADGALGRFQRERAFRFDPSDAASAIARAADIALVLDADGVVADVAVNTVELARLGVRGWVGRPFADVVTVESASKTDALLAGGLEGPRRWRQVNHPSEGADLPVEYAVVAVATDGSRILAGRELSVVAAMQQRLVAAQAEAEREYARARVLEQRYRILFQMTAEAVLVAEADSERIIEANPAAAELFDAKSSRLASMALPSLFDPAERGPLTQLIAAARGGGSAEAIRLRSASGRPLTVSASSFLQGRRPLVVVRAEAADGAAATAATSPFATMVERMPEGFVVCDEAGRVLTANAAFVEMAQGASVEQVRGEPLARWMGRTGVDADVLFATLRQFGTIRDFRTAMGGPLGTSEDVEVTGVALPPDLAAARFGLVLRPVRPHVATAVKGFAPSVERMTELVGRVPLRDLVRETTDLMERLCIDAALRLSENNRASAAEMLGLSRQSLYVKMRRFGQLRPDENPA